MKKILLPYLYAILFIALICFACNKHENVAQITEKENHTTQQTATWIYAQDAKTWLMKLLFLTGHDVTVCGGKCMKLFGEYGHIDCRGFGNACSNTVVGRLVRDEEDNYYLILTEHEALGDYLEYHFPDRSLFITNPQNNTELWINIHEQILCRDSAGMPFIIQDIWFSEEPELDNL